MSRSAAELYKTQAIMTAPPAKLVAMCYDRAIGALKDAIRAIDNNDIQARFDNATRAANIIAHLWSTLDLDRGGEIAQNLSNIYGFAMGRLPDVNTYNDPKAAQEIIDLLTPLAQSWNTLADRGETKPAAPPPQAGQPRPQPPRQAPAQSTPPASPSGGVAISI